MRIGSSTTTVVELGGGCGAAVAWGGCTSPASTTRRMGAEKSNLEVAASETREIGLSTGAFFDFIFFYTTVEGGRGAEKDSISTFEEGEEATGEAGGEGSKCSDGGSDLN